MFIAYVFNVKQQKTHRVTQTLKHTHTCDGREISGGCLEWSPLAGRRVQCIMHEWVCVSGHQYQPL